MIVKKLVNRNIEVNCSMCDEEQLIPQGSPDCTINFSFGYGSKYDMGLGTTYFCPKCADRVYDTLNREFPGVKFNSSTEDPSFNIRIDGDKDE